MAVENGVYVPRRGEEGKRMREFRFRFDFLFKNTGAPGPGLKKHGFFQFKGNKYVCGLDADGQGASSVNFPYHRVTGFWFTYQGEEKSSQSHPCKISLFFFVETKVPFRVKN